MFLPNSKQKECHHLRHLWLMKVKVTLESFLLHSLRSVFSWDFLKTTEQPTIYHRPPTNQLTDQMHWPPSYRPPTSKKFEDQKNIEIIFDINYNFKAWNAEHLNSCSASSTHINKFSKWFSFFYFKESFNGNNCR